MAGNELRSGLVVYLTADGRWTREYGSAHVLGSDKDCRWAEQRGRDAVSHNELIDPCLVKVTAGVNKAPEHIREQIRRSGPTCMSFETRIIEPIRVEPQPVNAARERRA